MIFNADAEAGSRKFSQAVAKFETVWVWRRRATASRAGDEARPEGQHHGRRTRQEMPTSPGNHVVSVDAGGLRRRGAGDR